MYSRELLAERLQSALERLGTGFVPPSQSDLQLWLRTDKDRYRTQRYFAVAFLKNDAPFELAPGDSVRVQTFWFTGVQFDTTGLRLEYSDFASVGRVHTSDSIVENPLQSSLKKPKERP